MAGIAYGPGRLGDWAARYDPVGKGCVVSGLLLPPVLAVKAGTGAFPSNTEPRPDFKMGESDSDDGEGKKLHRPLA